MQRPAAIKVTDAAAARVQEMLDSHDGEALGVRIGVKAQGCSGLSYTMDFTDEVGPHDEVVESHGVKIIIDPKAVMFLLGTEMDYKTDAFQSGFSFTNPNAKGMCGCGESFHV